MSVQKEEVSKQIFKKIANANRKEAEQRERLARQMTKLYVDFNENEIAADKSVSGAMQARGLTAADPIYRGRHRFWHNLYSLKMLLFSANFHWDELDANHVCLDDCEHESKFSLLIMSIFESTTKIEKILDEWAEIEADKSMSPCSEKFHEVYEKLASELEKDDYKMQKFEY